MACRNLTDAARHSGVVVEGGSGRVDLFSTDSRSWKPVVGPPGQNVGWSLAGGRSPDGVTLAVGVLHYRVDVYRGGACDAPAFQIEDHRRASYLLGFGDTIAMAGDIDGDGSQDLLVACREVLDQGDWYYAALYSGSDGTELGTVNGHSRMLVTGPGGDFDQDGIPDLLLGIPEEEQIAIISGAKWSVLRQIVKPTE